MMTTGGFMPQNTLPPGAEHWPSYLPYPRAIHALDTPVPNAQSFNFPTSQFAPDTFPAGSRPFQPYSWDQVYRPFRITGNHLDTREMERGRAGVPAPADWDVNTTEFQHTSRMEQAGYTPQKDCGCGGKSKATGYGALGGCGCGSYGSTAELTDLSTLDDTNKTRLALAFAAGVVVGVLVARRRRG
jgi:hypothetical protein